MLFGFLKKKPLAVIQPSSEKLKKVLAHKIPEHSVAYILDLWTQLPFNFRIAGSRKTCLGNYTFKNNQHFITVNGDSNPYSFLVTLVHEIAHQHVTHKHKGLFRRKVSPHGVEWKSTFSQLMLPLQNAEVFPMDLLLILKKHMLNPAASSTKDPVLARGLAQYSEKKSESSGILLDSIAIGAEFIFNQRQYKKIESRRTRSLVQLADSTKRYTIPNHAEVLKVQI